ncbi:MAG: DnaJ domain-containing protein [Acidobacteriaceae bacterium]|jgi:DnaJ-class molecular chaperone|nr:DnaJ domain-containing protein [Acidobacteriaceae bacterium]
MDFKDYYATLGVSKTATDKELKQAYRKLARKFHPDVNAGDKSAEAKFKEINEAHEVLGDPEKRRKYDELGANWRMYEQAAPGGGGQQAGGWHSPFGGPGSKRPMTQKEVEEIFGGATSFSDFFNTFFSGGGQEPRSRAGRTRARGPRPGRDVEQEITLALDDAYHGTTRRLAIQHNEQTRTVDVRIPAGVSEGSRVRIAGEGEPGTAGAKAGDLYLRIHLAPHATFERRGNDLYTRVSLPLTTAVLGGEVDVPTLSGKSLRLRVPATTQQGQLFRLKGHGMPSVNRQSDTGDLYATADVQLPRQITPEQKIHFDALVKSGL